MSARTLASRTAPGVSPAVVLKQARDHQYRWPPAYGGFAATVLLHTEHTVYVGAFAARGPREVSVRVDGPAQLERWATGQLDELLTDRWHRGTTDPDADAEVEVSLEVDDKPNHPLGFQLTVSRATRVGTREQYRVRDGRISEVVRHEPHRVTRVATLASTSTGDGRELPAAVLTSYADPDSGALTAVESVEISWSRIGGVLLPVHRRVVRQDATGSTAWDLEVVDHVAWR